VSTIAIRLEGGIGDHLLGLRPLRRLHERYPEHEIVIFSDCAGQEAQLKVVRLCPLVSQVVAVEQIDEPVNGDTWGRLERIKPAFLAQMRSADLFFDGWGEHLCVPEARSLNVPVFDILRERPELSIPAGVAAAAERLLSAHADCIFVGLNITKYGGDVLRPHLDSVWQVLARILDDPRTRILHFFRSTYDWAHWPEPKRVTRRKHSLEDTSLAWELTARHSRIIPCVDLPIETVSALLARCAYFIGMDNGIKHLAWALDVPLTFFVKHDMSPEWIVRWAPDAHRMVTLGAAPALLEAHVEACRTAIADARVARDEPQLVPSRDTAR
jgi:hypothetical protein